MKTTVSVTAIKPFELNGQSYQPTQLFTVSPIDAVVLAKKRLVTLTKKIQKKAVVVAAPEPEAVQEHEAPKKKRGTYKRRDLQAEETTELVPPVVSVVEPEPTPAPAEDTSTYIAPAYHHTYSEPQD